MSSIDRINQLIFTIRNATIERSKKKERTGEAAAARANTASPGGGTQDLQEGIVHDLQGLDLNVDTDRKIARQRFVQTVLLREFGDDFANHPSFAATAHRVSEAFSEDAELRQDLDSLLQGLQQPRQI